MVDRFTCPRRFEGGHGFDVKDADSWLSDDSCTYCGSLNPDTFMARIEAGTASVGSTDKNYKAYIENDGGESFKQTYRECPRDKEMTGAAGNKYMASSCAEGPDACTHWVTREVSQTKFYFMHLSESQRTHFIELLNSGRIKFSGGFRFYVLPFFIRRKPPQPEPTQYTSSVQ
jgi:ferredoxin